MKKRLMFIVISLVVICGCASGGKIMTSETFSKISVGMTTTEVQKKYGKPYSIKNLGNGEVEYTYIEKVTIGKAKVLQEKYYLIIFKNDKVTSTNIKTLNRPIYEKNSYEMQTSYNK